jgi:thioredoxin reductase (NADPH)
MEDDDEATNPTLSEEHLAQLGARGEERTLTDGEVLYGPGEPHEHFYVVLDGEILIIDGETEEGRVIAELGRGKFLGEYGLLVGGLGLMTNVARGKARLLCVPIAVLLDVVASDAVLSDTILRAFLLRRGILVDRGLGVKVFGDPRDPETRRLLDFLARSRVPHGLLEIEDADAGPSTLLSHFTAGEQDTPLVVLGGRVLRRPSIAALAVTLGLGARGRPVDVLDLLVVGAGPAGLAAAVYGGSEGLTTAVLDRTGAGGQAGTSSRIENYLGFPAGISGAELTARAELQTAKFGATIVSPANAVRLEPGTDQHVVGLKDGRELAARCVVIASGARYRGLDLPRVEEFQGLGVQYAATQVEAAACRKVTVAVVGGGNSAGQAALFLADQAARVVLIVRRPSLRETMSQYLMERIETDKRIELRTESEVRELHGGERLDAITVHARSGDESRIDVSALFLFTGAKPHTGWLTGCVALDDAGFVLTGDEVERRDHRPRPLESSVAGVFAVGDARSGSIKRVAAAVGEGAMVLAFVHEHLARGAARPPLGH